MILLGILLYFILGATLPFVRQKEVSNQAKQRLDVNDFYSDAVSVDRAAIVEDSVDALKIRLRMLNEAKHSIILSSFSFKTDRSSQEIFATVLAAANRGVKVQIIGDGLSCGVDMKADPMYYALAQNENVTIKYYNIFNPLKPWTFNGRLHDKYIIIDDRMLLLGGRNTSNYFLGDYNTRVLSYDRDIFVYNTKTEDTNKESVIYDTIEYFKTIWESKHSKVVFDSVPFYKKNKARKAEQMLKKTYETLLTEKKDCMTETFDYIKYTTQTNKISLMTNPINIMSKEPYIWYQTMELMKRAKEKVFIQTPYAVLNKAMEKDLLEISKQIPSTKILLNSIEVGDNYVASSDYLWNKQDVVDTGFTIYEYAGDHSMHNKSVLIDDSISIIGSYNFDMRSVYLDTETMLVVDGEEFNQKLESVMNTMETDSLELDKDGEYIQNDTVRLMELPLWKKISFRITSFLFQVVRYLL